MIGLPLAFLPSVIGTGSGGTSSTEAAPNQLQDLLFPVTNLQSKPTAGSFFYINYFM